MYSEQFNKYESLLRKWQKKINLVAAGTLPDLRTRHFADSVQLADLIPKGSKIIDLGSGAGFPGAVLSIAGFDVTCVESDQRKAAFLSELKQTLGLSNLTVANERAEDFIKKLSIQPANDYVFTARAFAPLIKILDMTKHIKSRLFLLKGRDLEAEIKEAEIKHKFDYSIVDSKIGDGKIVIIKRLEIRKANRYFT
jgi:16S rRNA (guanine527-N7)-methyltransferase